MKQISLLQLERSYIEALQDYGENAPQTLKVKLNLIELLSQTGRNEIQQKRQGEKYFQRAIELARTLDMEELIIIKYKTFMLQAEYHEYQHQNKQAYNLLIQLLPLSKTTNNEIIMIQIQILNHIIENGRLCKLKGIIPLNEQLLQLMEQVGLTFYLCKQFPKKFQQILFQALSFQAKILQNQKKDKEAALLYCQCYHLSNELLGSNEERTKNYKKIYEELSERIDVNIKIQDQIEEDDIEYNQQIITPRIIQNSLPTYNNYIVNVDAVRAPKVQKRIDKSNIIKQTSLKTTLQIKEIKEIPQIFIIKNQSKRPQSSQATTKLASPTRNVSFFSKKTSDRQQLKIPSLEQSVLKELEDAQPINQIQELIINRPQYESHRRIDSAKIRKPTSNNQLQVPLNTQRYQMREQSKNFISLKPDQYSKNQKPSNTPSSQKIERTSQKKITNNVAEVLPTSGNIRLQGSAKDLTHDYKEEKDSQEEKYNQTDCDNPPVIIMAPTDPIIAKFLETYSMDILLEAIEKLQRKARHFIYKKHYRQSRQERGERKIQHSPSRVITNKLMSRSNTYGHGMMEIVDIKISENEVSKKIFKIFQSSNNMDWYPINFYDKLFTDFETSKWVLENPRFRGQCLSKYSEKEQFQQINVEMIQQALSNPKKTASLQVIGSVEISNHTRKIQVRFIIDQLGEHYKDVQSYDDLMDLFDQLLNIYLHQEDLFNEWLDNFQEQTLYRTSSSKRSASGQRKYSFEFTKERRLEYQKNMQYYQYLLSKVLFLIKRKSYVRTMNGYKFKSEPQNQQVSIQNFNNVIYQKKLSRIKQCFQQFDLVVGQDTKPILSKRRNRKRTKDKNFFIHPSRNQTIIRENTSGDEDVPSIRDSPFISLKDTGIIIGSELESKQLIMSGTPLLQPPTIKQITKSNFRNLQPSEPVPDLIEIFPLETQDYLQRYFPEFNLNVLADYTPAPCPSMRKKRTELTYKFKTQHQSSKFEKLEYKPIHSENYLILTQIVKIENQFYYLTLTKRLHLKQIYGKDLWEDSLDIQLKELIDYQIGRTGYIIDLIKLQTVLQQKLEIVNTRIQIKPDETDNSQQKKLLKLFRNNPKLYYAIESNNFIDEGLKGMSEASNSQDETEEQPIDNKRLALIDIVFLLGILNNKYVQYSNHLPNCYLLQRQNDKITFAQPEQPRKPKFPFRLILSHEDVNKHISRTNEQTINAKDISLFPHYNSVFLVRQNQYVYKPVGVKLHILTKMKKLYQEMRNDQASAQLLIYFNNSKKISFYLNSEQTEKWAHLFQIDGKIKQHMFGHKTTLKKTLVGYQLYLNENRKTLSKDIRFQLMQNKLIKTEQYFVQTKINQIGTVFVSAQIYQQIMLLKIMPAGNKSKQHLFLHPIYDEDPIQLMYTLCKYFVLKETYTYTKLELFPITQNTIRRQYLLSNQYNDNNILIGRKSYSRVVYKQVKKIDKSYFIITVTLIGNYFQLYLYNQSNCRKFYFTIHRSDFLKMNQYFLDSIFPEQPDEVVEQFFRPWKLSEIHKIYTLITRAPETFRNRTQIYIQQLKNTKKSLKRSVTSEFSGANFLQRQSTLQLNAESIIEERQNNECWLFDQLLVRNYNSTFEKKLWIEIIKQMSINQNQIILDTYKKTIDEIVYSNDRICNFVCYIPCHEIQQTFRWQPIRLRIHSYDSCKTVDVPVTYRGKQVQVQKMCKDLWLNYEQNHQIPSNQDIMKINKTNDNELIQYQLLYKDVFMKHKMLIIAIFLNNDVFHVRINSDANFIIKKLKINQVELKIPYIRQLLTLSPYEAGRRISCIYRNNFIHASFLNL